MAEFKRRKANKDTAKNADPLFALAELLMKIDKREKIVSIPEDSSDGNKLKDAI